MTEEGEYCDRCLNKGVNRVGDREDIREDNAEDEEEDEEEDNDDEAERVPAVTVVNRLKENIEEESRRMIKLYGWLDQTTSAAGSAVCRIAGAA
ncbi:hypothetical protein FOXYSP1_20441 [Fusarium oxysporum f. sp. phaseoli]